MTDEHAADRFDYHHNLERTCGYRGYRSHYWPPAERYTLDRLDLAQSAPKLDPGLAAALAALRTAVENAWLEVKDVGIRTRRRFNDPVPVANAMEQVAALLPGADDRRAAQLRADAVRNGYDDAVLKELATLDEEHTIVAGQISTWYGKESRGLPTAFACRRDPRGHAAVTRALADKDAPAAYLRSLHADLRLGDTPAFGPAQLFFMAGEGNLHPKHIAYFLPEDEGVKHSPFKKTFYFANTHRALLEHVSAPLAAEHILAGPRFEPADTRFADIPVLGVLGHELGHFVHRPITDFAGLNEADRWASVVLQEVAADVFGTLILADAWADRFGAQPTDVIAYYLAECLRYVARGLGHFPDSDGMYLQLSYFVQVGALTMDTAGGVARLTGDPQTVLAGLRSLARVLADTLLADRAPDAVALHRDFGPATAGPLEALIADLRRLPFASIEYTQEHVRTHP